MTRLARTLCLSILIALLPTLVAAENSAPSSHMVFDDNFDGDIVINEVRVPKDGEALYTYYETLGWRGKGAGYAGIQAHPKAHLYIFSIWDHKEHKAPIKAVYRGAGTKTVGFGGEGTGLKSWNFDLGWSTGVWYTLAARTWPVGDHTFYGFWVRAGDTKKWTHLVTMDVAVKTTFKGGTDAFIEDWLSTGAKPRTSHLRNGWKRRTDGTWFPFGRGRYSVNYWDLDPGKRSYNFRRSWDGGVARDETGEYYYMIAGGAKTRPTTKNPSSFKIARTEKEPGFAPIRVQSAEAKHAGDKLTVKWANDATTTPQFSYAIRVFDNRQAEGKPLAEIAKRVAHARTVTIDATEFGKRGKFIELSCVDILDRKSSPVIATIDR